MSANAEALPESPKSPGNKDPVRERIMYWRLILQLFWKAAQKNAPPPERATEPVVKQVLDYIALMNWTRELENDTGIRKAVGKFYGITKAKYPETGAMAKELLDRWAAGNHAPGVLQSSKQDEEIEDSDEDEEVEESFDERDERTSWIMRNITKSGTAGKVGNTWRIIDMDKKKEANVFGDNGIKLGQWWPLQICALRDGAHGSRMGGIAGTENQGGAFSIVIAGGKGQTSGGADYQDEDDFDSLWYSGTHAIDKPRSGQAGPGLTYATRALLASYTRYRGGDRDSPVRVIRGKGATKWAPPVGLRYDGLYYVVEYEIAGSQDNSFYRFKLVRKPGQAPYSELKKRPNAEESLWYRHRDRRSRD